jgi:hypothetical protein
MMEQVITGTAISQDQSTSATAAISIAGTSATEPRLHPLAGLVRSSAPSAPTACDLNVGEQRAPSFTIPQEVLDDRALTDSDKRALLASWASDACAVESLPNWRKLPETGALVPLDDILDALQALDGDALH